MAYLELKNVNKTYGEGKNATEVLTDINLTIEEGEFVFNPPATPWEGATFHQMRASRSFDVHPGGQRVLVRELSKESQAAQREMDHFGLFENFFDYLNEKVPINPK